MTATTPEGASHHDAPSLRGRRHRRRWNPNLVAGSVFVGLIVLAAAVSFVWTPYDPTQVDTSARLVTPSVDHWLGTDKFGRDIFSQLMVGARTTLFVGVISVGLAALAGVPLGIFAGMTSRRWAGEVTMRFNDLLLAFPSLLLAIMLAAIFGGSTLVAMIAIGIGSIPSFALLIRGGTMQAMKSEYVLAARVVGRRPVAIGVRHILPNVSGLIIVQSSVLFAIAILGEAALSFLGLGTPPPTPSWGRMLQESQTLLWQAPRLAFIPGIAIALAVLGFNLLGDGLRDIFDPRLEDRR
ncbi:ABC transporter permease [Amycolatopsis sp. GM8]|uniref:ABC transporter permease n=1 Tax=Amycolatopsis sp. GM8 TaxID=2896530 RepID=UPI001F371E8A|nr:ABC transporter permease [Amycolatopsis sp. GM8]